MKIAYRLWIGSLTKATMANSLQKMNPLEEEQSHANGCRVFVNSSHTPNSPLAYFISISIPQPKIRIKIPKVLAKSIKKTSDDHQCSEKTKKTKNWGFAPKKVFAKRVGLIFSKVFGHKQTEEICSSSECENGKSCSNEDKFGFDAMGSVESLGRGSEKGANGKCGQSRDVAEMALTKKKKKNVLVSAEGGKKKRFDREEQPSMISLFNKKDRFSFSRSFSSANGFAATESVTVQLKSSPESARVSARTSTTHQKSKAERAIRKNLIKLLEEEGERQQTADQELCKKRILMGGKCRPLNHSGTLQYDKNGILLPEIIP